MISFEVFDLNELAPRINKRIKKLHIIIALLTAFSLLLCIAGCVCCAIVLRREGNYKAAIKSQRGTIAEKQRIIDEEMIPIEKFKDYADRYGVNIHFIQQFIIDAIVYKNDSGICYSPINHTLKMNSVDTSLISDVNGRKVYVENDLYDVKTVVDVSQYQGSVNWSAVAGDGVDAAIIRLGYRGYGASGDLKTDSYFYSNISGAAAAGLDVGVYFFSQAITPEEAIAEAEFVLNKISAYNVALPIVFDMETINGVDARANNLSAKQITEITTAFCEKIAAAGYTPMVYGNIEWMCDKLELDKLEKYPKWFAQYTSRPFFPYDMLMWQYTESGSVNGIYTGADLSLMFIPKNK